MQTRRAPVLSWSFFHAISLACSLGGCDGSSSLLDAAVLADAASPPDTRDEVDAGLAPDSAVLLDASGALDASVEAPDSAVSPDAALPLCATDAGGAAPTFRALYADIIAPYRCAECHRAGEVWSTLDLSSVETAYANLLGVTGCDGVTPRVTPCDPEESTLALVPTARSEPCGGRHTFGGVNPTGIVTPEEGDRIRAWIAAGAVF